MRAIISSADPSSRVAMPTISRADHSGRRRARDS
jgi:hypothetical protein